MAAPHVVFLADVGVIFFLSVPITGSKTIWLLSLVMISSTLASPALSHILTPTFHVTLTPTKYDSFHDTNGTDASTSTNLASLLTPSTPTCRSLYTESNKISYNITCIKLDMFDLYTST
ncbi:unnamed protein product [Spirodela intermedia]|uniref:Uncharacterized protein n=1 Tax=Spirodela intermedia TaxID=51605 RepID=A0A7I8KPL5_SPIIN|nr:unnamed protein product [Spirodela intermedia]